MEVIFQMLKWTKKPMNIFILSHKVFKKCFTIHRIDFKQDIPAHYQDPEFLKPLALTSSDKSSKNKKMALTSVANTKSSKV